MVDVVGVGAVGLGANVGIFDGAGEGTKVGIIGGVGVGEGDTEHEIRKFPVSDGRQSVGYVYGSLDLSKELQVMSEYVETVTAPFVQVYLFDFSPAASIIHASN